MNLLNIDDILYLISISGMSYMLISFKEFCTPILAFLFYYKKNKVDQIFDLFKLIKFITIVMTSLIFLFFDNSETTQKVLLILNIFETFIDDKLENILIGMMLCFILIYQDVDFLWIIVYTIWNICFIYNKEMSFQSAYILLVPLISEIISRNSWVIIRGISILCHMAICYQSPKINEIFTIEVYYLFIMINYIILLYMYL